MGLSQKRNDTDLQRILLEWQTFIKKIQGYAQKLVWQTYDFAEIDIEALAATNPLFETSATKRNKEKEAVLFIEEVAELERRYWHFQDLHIQDILEKQALEAAEHERQFREKQQIDLRPMPRISFINIVVELKALKERLRVIDKIILVLKKEIQQCEKHIQELKEERKLLQEQLVQLELFEEKINQVMYYSLGEIKKEINEGKLFANFKYIDPVRLGERIERFQDKLVDEVPPHEAGQFIRNEIKECRHESVEAQLENLLHEIHSEEEAVYHEIHKRLEPYLIEKSVIKVQKINIQVKLESNQREINVLEIEKKQKEELLKTISQERVVVEARIEKIEMSIHEEEKTNKTVQPSNDSHYPSDAGEGVSQAKIYESLKIVKFAVNPNLQSSQDIKLQELKGNINEPAKDLSKSIEKESNDFQDENSILNKRLNKTNEESEEKEEPPSPKF